MEKEVRMATLIDDEGTEFELEVIKEFNYKDKKYAVLYEEECDCEEDCDCEDECDENCECDCHKEECDGEGHIYVFEVVKGSDGQDVYNEIDEKLMRELIPVVEKELYPTEE